MARGMKAMKLMRSMKGKKKAMKGMKGPKSTGSVKSMKAMKAMKGRKADKTVHIRKDGSSTTYEAGGDEKIEKWIGLHSGPKKVELDPDKIFAIAFCRIRNTRRQIWPV